MREKLQAGENSFSKSGLIIRAFVRFLKSIFRAGDDLVLETYVQLVEITAPTPHPHNQIGIFFRVRLRVEQLFAADRIDLELMSVQIDKAFYEHRHLFHAEGGDTVSTTPAFCWKNRISR